MAMTYTVLGLGAPAAAAAAAALLAGGGGSIQWRRSGAGN